MPRPKTRPDADILELALALMHERGPEALTFANLASASGLSPATLVQRFGTKNALKQATLLHAWDGLDRKTAMLSANATPTPQGAIALLVDLSRDYGGIESYAEGLLVLREDLRDPALRARGATWKAALCAALDACFATTAGAPEAIGSLMAAQWQGSLLWWSFEPKGPVEEHVERHLQAFVAALRL
jgi:AcrR family transcriptional regulator